VIETRTSRSHARRDQTSPVELRCEDVGVTDGASARIRGSSSFHAPVARPAPTGRLTLPGGSVIESALFGEAVVKRTFQPHRKSRLRTHGFRKRMKTRAGREILRRRRRRGRKQLTVTIAKK
jgi:large subunit ribosomal protein L34